MPTPPDKTFSFVIEYNVDDTSGNAAPTARRLIRVVCPPPEAFCSDPETGAATCTVGGVCGRPAALMMMASAAAGNPIPGSSGAAGAAAAGATPRGAAAAMAAAGSSGSAAAAAATAADMPPAPPNITLLGPPSAEVQAGFGYDRCAPTAPLSALCDRGASAVDALDGPLDRVITVCGSPWRGAGGARLAPVLLACGIDGDRPGTYSINFTATNSAGLSAAVSRRIVVRARCPEGEQLCPDRVTCSEGGTCFARAPAPTSAGNASANATTAAAAGAPTGRVGAATAQAAAKAAAAAMDMAPNQPPNITLVTTGTLGPDVYVRRVFGSYPACGDGKLPSEDAPCELGVTAFDPDGGANASALDISDSAVVCPPPACLAAGCSPLELRRHTFRAKVGGGPGVWVPTGREEQCVCRAASHPAAPVRQGRADPKRPIGAGPAAVAGWASTVARAKR